MSIIAVAAMMLVSCKKDDNGKDNGKDNGDDNTPTDQYTGPVQGTSTWSVIGAVLETNWDTDYVMAESEGVFVLKNMKLTAADKFKIRKDKNWDENRGGVFAELGAGFDVVDKGADIQPALDGFYDIYYNPEVEQMAVCEKDGQPTWKELPEPILVDGNMSDWNEIADLTSTGTSRIRSWKFTSSKNNLYFYLVLRKNRMSTASTLSIGFSWDESGSLSADNLAGLEAVVVFQPFTNASNGTPSCVDGTINDATINGVASTAAGITAFGADPDPSATGDSADYYLEVCIPKASVPNIPASGNIQIGAGYNWYKTDLQDATL